MHRLNVHSKRAWSNDARMFLPDAMSRVLSKATSITTTTTDRLLPLRSSYLPTMCSRPTQPRRSLPN